METLVYAINAWITTTSVMVLATCVRTAAKLAFPLLNAQYANLDITFMRMEDVKDFHQIV